jgi:hypothetical protein
MERFSDTSSSSKGYPHSIYDMPSESLGLQARGSSKGFTSGFLKGEEKNGF